MIQKCFYTSQSTSEAVLTELLGRLLLELSVELGGKEHFPRFSIVFGAFTVNIYYLLFKASMCERAAVCWFPHKVLLNKTLSSNIPISRWLRMEGEGWPWTWSYPYSGLLMYTEAPVYLPYLLQQFHGELLYVNTVRFNL